MRGIKQLEYWYGNGTEGPQIWEHLRNKSLLVREAGEKLLWESHFRPLRFQPELGTGQVINCKAALALKWLCKSTPAATCAQGGSWAVAFRH